MGLLGDIKIENIGSVFSGLGDLFIKIRTAITGIDPAKKAELESYLAQVESRVQEAQNAINLVEAQSTSIFVSGWRPAVAWVCVMGFLIHFIVNPVMLWAAQLLKYTFTAPSLDIDSLMSLVVALLGLGAYRTIERVKGVQRN
jgi:hypothetical protein